MAVNGWIIERTVDLAHPPKTLRNEQPYEITYTGDMANPIWTVHVLQDGQPVALGGSVKAYIKRIDGAEVVSNGTISGNTVSVQLGGSNFGQPGYAWGILRYTDSTTNATVTLDALTMIVQADPEGTSVLDPDDMLPTLQELLAELDDMRDATAAAEAAVDFIANAYSSNSTYAVGDYAIYDGKLYRCTTEITTAETWTAAHWKRVVFGDEVSASNENLNNTNVSVLDVSAPHVPDSAWEIGGLSDPGGTENTSTRLIRTGFFPISDEAQYSFTGVTTDRVWFNYFYDAEKNYISRQSSGIPAGSKYVRFSYGFTSASGTTVESYGFANLIADWSCEITSPMQKQINELTDNTNTALEIANLALALNYNNAVIISNGTDYNTLTTPGNYRVNNVASAETMTNCPGRGGHRLFVMSSTSANRILQIIITNDVQPGIFIRFYSDQWQSWYKVPLEAV